MPARFKPGLTGVVTVGYDAAGEPHAQCWRHSKSDPVPPALGSSVLFDSCSGDHAHASLVGFAAPLLSAMRSFRHELRSLLAERPMRLIWTVLDFPITKIARMRRTGAGQLPYFAMAVTKKHSESEPCSSDSTRLDSTRKN
eukprot:2314203-Prymnesium_polylepis.1